MINSREKNQRTVREAIAEYVKRAEGAGSTDPGGDQDLLRFTKFLVSRLLTRMEDHDCYLIDMLDDIERMEE